MAQEWCWWQAGACVVWPPPFCAKRLSKLLTCTHTHTHRDRHRNTQIKSVSGVAGETAQQIRALAPLTEDRTLSLAPTCLSLTAPYNLGSKGSVALF